MEDPSHTAPRRAVVRIMLSKEKIRERTYMLRRLAEAGATIVSEGRFGIDVLMDEGMIRKVLGMKLVWDEDLARLEKTDFVPESTPLAYIPRPPEEF